MATSRIDRPRNAQPRRPSRFSRAIAQWVRQIVSAGAATRSELAIHGLAYLGVALTFVGALGFVLFAYGTVESGLRTAAFLVIPVFLFAAAAFLYGRGTTLVPASLEVLAGAITPVTLFAALGGYGPVTTPLLRTAVALGLAALYFISGLRRPTAPIRYLVVPMLWVAAWALGLLVANGGYSAWQVAVTAGAIVTSLAVVRLRPTKLLTHPTRVAARFGVGVTFVLAAVFSVSGGDPALSIALTGLASVVSLNLVVDRSRKHGWLSYLETLLVAATLAQLVSGWGVPTVGALAVVVALALLEWQDWRRPDAIAASLLAALAIAGLMLALGEPLMALVTGTVAVIWVHARRLKPLASMRGLKGTRLGRIALAALAGALPAVPAFALLQLVDAPRALLVISAVLLAITAGIRLLRVRDVLYDTWLPVVAVGISAVTGVMSQAPSGELAAAAVLAGLILAAAPAWTRVRIWSGYGGLAWGLYLTLATAGHADLWPPLLGVAGVAAVSTSVFKKNSSAGHLTLVGLLSVALALGLASTSGTRTASLAALTACLLLAVVANELQRSSLIELAGSAPLAERWTRLAVVVPQIAFAASFPLLLVEAGSDIGIFNDRRSLIGGLDGLIAVAYAARVRRIVGRRPLAPIMATAAVVLSIIGVAVATPDRWPSIAAVAASIAVVAFMGGDARRPFMTWVAWVMSIVLAILLSQAAGLSAGSLPKATFVIGAAFVIGGLLVDDVIAGRRRSGQGLRVGWLTQPVSLGALALPAGLAFIFGDGPSIFGWWALAGAAVYFVIAVQIRAGAVTAVTYALAAFVVAALTNMWPFDHPAFFVPMAAVLVLIAWATARSTRESDPLLRWDLAPLVVAHLVAGIALARVPVAGMAGATCLGFAGLALLTAAWRKQLTWAVAGVVLAVVGAAVEGPGALALALYAVAVVCAVVATRASGLVSTASRWMCIAATATAWVQTVLWAAWSLDVAISITSLASGGASLLVAAAVRRRLLTRTWTWPAATVVAVGVVASAAVASVYGMRLAALTSAGGLVLFALAVSYVAASLRVRRAGVVPPLAVAWASGLALSASGWSVDQQAFSTALLSGAIAVTWAGLIRTGLARFSEAAAAWACISIGGIAFAVFATVVTGGAVHTDALAIAGGIALQAAAVSISAKPLGVSWLRETGALLAAAAGGTLLYATALPTDATVMVTVGAGVTALVFSLLLSRLSPGSAWLLPAAGFAAIADLSAVSLAVDLWPNRGLLSLTLLTLGAEAAAAGITMRRTALVCVAPALLCAAWLVYASTALAGNPEWLTVPIGVAVLVTVELARWDRRLGHPLPAASALIALELLGMALVVVTALVQTITDSILYGLAAIGIALMLVAWGVITRVRRRVFAGALAVVGALVLILAVPVVHFVPDVTGALLWVTLGGVGLLLLFAATTIEHNRARVRATVRRLDQLMSGWE